jgi:hypothetical protein
MQCPLPKVGQYSPSQLALPILSIMNNAYPPGFVLDLVYTAVKHSPCTHDTYVADKSLSGSDDDETPSKTSGAPRTSHMETSGMFVFMRRVGGPACTPTHVEFLCISLLCCI